MARTRCVERYVTDEVRERAAERVDDLLGILFYHYIDSARALDDRWDRMADDGFETMRDEAESLLRELGVDVGAVADNEIRNDGGDED
jgi:hypothetical protein